LRAVHLTDCISPVIAKKAKLVMQITLGKPTLEVGLLGGQQAIICNFESAIVYVGSSTKIPSGLTATSTIAHVDADLVKMTGYAT